MSPINPEHINRRLQRQIIFAFIAIYAVVLFIFRPNPTTGQLVFRTSMAVLGVVGFVLVSRRR